MTTTPELLVSRGWANSPANVTAQTVADYQEFHGLVVDGDAGPVTRRSLEAPRVCGLPDRMETEENRGRGHGKNRFTWFFHQTVRNLKVTSAELQYAFEWAFQAWRAAGVDIHGSSVIPGDNPDLNVHGVDMGGPGGVLADSTLYQLPGRHRYDTNEPWTVKMPPPPSKIMLPVVVGHELGHLLNLGHLDSRRFPRSLMNPIYDPNVPMPGPHDAQAMWDLGYPKTQTEPETPTDPDVPPSGLTKADIREVVTEVFRSEFAEAQFKAISRLGNMIE